MLFTYDFPNSGFVSYKWVWSEILELIEEIKTINLKGIRNELCDVYTCMMYAIEYHTGIPMPLFWLRSAIGWKKRVTFWELYLAKIGLEFKLEYMKYGSNYLRPEKRRKVFELAVKDQIYGK
jgi:hypothetical protein